MHFAKVKNNIVEQVIVAEQEFIDALPKEDGVSWLQTSFNTLQGKHYDPETKQEDDKPPLRGNYAGRGYVYDPTLDVFAPPQPYPSWKLDANGVWQPPHKNGLVGVVAPEQSADPSFHEGVDNNWSLWDEDAYNLDNTKGWGKHVHDHEGHHPE